MKTYMYVAAILVLIMSVSLLSPILAPVSQTSCTEDVVSEKRAAHNSKKILMIYTGGTLGMKETAKGYAPNKGYIEKQLKKILSLYPSENNKIGEYDFISFDPLLDSSNMAPKDWNKIIRAIRDSYDFL